MDTGRDPQSPDSRAGKARGKPARKSYGARSSEQRVGYPTRFEESTYDALKAASAVTNSSVNSIVTEAVEFYLGSDRFRRRLDSARAAQDEAIRKLSGADITDEKETP